MKNLRIAAFLLLSLTLVGCGKQQDIVEDNSLEQTETVETKSVNEENTEAVEDIESTENVSDVDSEHSQYTVYIINKSTDEYGTIYSAVTTDSDTETHYLGEIDLIVGDNAVKLDNNKSTESIEGTENIEDIEGTEAVEGTDLSTIFETGKYYVVTIDDMMTMSLPPQVVVLEYREATDDEINKFNENRSKNSTFKEDFERIKGEEPEYAYGDALRSQYTWSYEQIEVFKAWIEEQKQTSSELKETWESIENNTDAVLGY